MSKTAQTATSSLPRNLLKHQEKFFNTQKKFVLQNKIIFHFTTAVL